MAQPTPYEKSTDFTDLPDEQVKTKLDIEFANLEDSIGEVCVNLGLIQRDDGALVNGIVTPDSLSTATLNLLVLSDVNPRGAWLTLTLYASGDIVSETSGTYLCNTAHTSGVFATDLSAGKWILLASTAASTAASYSVTGATPPAEGIYKPAANTLGLSANSLDVLRLVGVNTAVNYLTITNSAAGDPLSIVATGTDTNIDIYLTPKGTGTVNTTCVNLTSTAVPVTGIYRQASDTVGISSRTLPVLLISNPSASAVNYWRMAGAATTFYPTISVEGSDTNIGIVFLSKGAAGHVFNTRGPGTGVTQLVIFDVASSVNYWGFGGSATGDSIFVTASGTDTNIYMGYRAKGTGGHVFYTAAGGAVQFDIVHTASSANYLRVTGGALGVDPVFSTVGSSTNINLVLTPKGTGHVKTAKGMYFSGALSADYPATGIAAYLATNIVALFSGSQPILVALNTSGSDTNFAVSTAATGSLNAGADGSTTNIILNLNSKGNASLLLKAGTVTALVCLNTTSGVNYLQITPAAAGNPVILTATGSDTDVDFSLICKGAGVLRFGTYTGTPGISAGTITIKDAGGTLRKLMVGT